MFPTFKYLSSDPRRITVLNKVDVHDFELLVVGDPDNGVYEWALYRGSECLSHSDEGFGFPAAAFRHGLNQVLA